MTRDTGFPATDAQHDYLHARRRHVLGRLEAAMRRDCTRDATLLSFDDVVDALGRLGGCDLGVQTIGLDSIIGSVGRHSDFDGQFRPAARSLRPRFERIAEAQRRGRPLPVVDVLRVGAVHFVRDGHCEVAVARELDRATIQARVVQVMTRLPAEAGMTRADLARKRQQRAFLERVSLRADQLGRLQFADPARFGELADRAEAFGFRLMQNERRVLPSGEMARRWLDEDYSPTVGRLQDLGLIRHDETETEAYLRLTAP
jgi:hypothetical protein